MLLVDIYLPALDQCYDFYLSEDIPVHSLIEDLLEMICHKEKLTADPKADWFLYHAFGKRMLSPAGTLAENGIQTGTHLILL